MASAPRFFRSIQPTVESTTDYADYVRRTWLQPAVSRMVKEHVSLSTLNITRAQPWFHAPACGFAIDLDEPGDGDALRERALLNISPNESLIVVSTAQVAALVDLLRQKGMEREAESMDVLVRQFELVFVGTVHSFSDDDDDDDVAASTTITFLPHMSGETIVRHFASYRSALDRAYQFWMTSNPDFSDREAESHSVIIYPSDMRPPTTAMEPAGPLPRIRAASGRDGVQFANWRADAWPRGHASPFVDTIDNDVLGRMTAKLASTLRIRHRTHDWDVSDLVSSALGDENPIDTALMLRSPLVQFARRNGATAIVSAMGMFTAQYVPSKLINPHTQREFRTIGLRGTAFHLPLNAAIVYDHVMNADWSDHELRVQFPVDVAPLGTNYEADRARLEQFGRDAWQLVPSDEYEMDSGRFVKLQGAGNLVLDEGNAPALPQSALRPSAYCFSRRARTSRMHSYARDNAGMELYAELPPQVDIERIVRGSIGHVYGSLQTLFDDDLIRLVVEFLSCTNPGDVYNTLIVKLALLPPLSLRVPQPIDLLRDILWNVMSAGNNTGLRGILIDFVTVDYNAMLRSIRRFAKPSRVAAAAVDDPFNVLTDQ